MNPYMMQTLGMAASDNNVRPMMPQPFRPGMPAPSGAPVAMNPVANMNAIRESMTSWAHAAAHPQHVPNPRYIHSYNIITLTDTQSNTIQAEVGSSTTCPIPSADNVANAQDESILNVLTTILKQKQELVPPRSIVPTPQVQANNASARHRKRCVPIVPKDGYRFVKKN